MNLKFVSYKKQTTDLPEYSMKATQFSGTLSLSRVCREQLGCLSPVMANANSSPRVQGTDISIERERRTVHTVKGQHEWKTALHSKKGVQL